MSSGLSGYIEELFLFFLFLVETFGFAVLLRTIFTIIVMIITPNNTKKFGSAEKGIILKTLVINITDKSCTKTLIPNETANFSQKSNLLSRKNLTIK